MNWKPLFGDPSDDPVSELLQFRCFRPHGEPRWLLEEHFLKPWHLKTDPMRFRRDVFRCRAAWILSVVGIHLHHIMISVRVSEASVYAKLRNSFDHVGLSIRHAGGRNARAIVFAKDNRRERFVKVPLSSLSTFLIENERSALRELRSDPDLQPLVPKSGEFAGCLAVENMNGVGRGRLSLSEILRVHQLLYRRSKTLLTIGDLEKLTFDMFDGTGCERVEHQAADLQLIKRALDTATAYLSRFRKTDLVDCYMAHGDFNASNVLVARDGTVRIIDWEFFGLKPRYFDVIFYLQLENRGNNPEETLSRLKRIGERIESGSSNFAWIDYLGFYFSIAAICRCKLSNYSSLVPKSDLNFHCDILKLIMIENSSYTRI